MANPEQLRLLKEGSASWNRWRRHNPEIEIELAQASLPRADLRGADLRQAMLSGADLRGANLIQANLAVADLTGADLTGANLVGSELSGADLTSADLRATSLYGGYTWSARFDRNGAPLTIVQGTSYP